MKMDLEFGSGRAMLQAFVVAGTLALAVPAWASGDAKTQAPASTSGQAQTQAPANAGTKAPAPADTAAQAAERQKRIAADRVFAEAHPEAAEARASLLAQLRLFPLLQVGELPIEAVKPHHLPLEVAGDGYRLRLPDLSAGLDGDRLVIGSIDAEFKALGPHRSAIRVTIPEKLVLLGADGQPGLEIAIGGQRIAGTWDNRLAYFVDFDGELTSLAGSMQGQPMVEIGAIRAAVKNKDVSADVIDLSATMEVETINANGLFTLARITATGDVQHLDIPAFERIRKLAEDREFVAKLAGLDRMELPEVQALLGPRLQSLGRYFDAARASYRLEGLSLAKDNFFAGPAAGGGIGAIEFAMNVDGIDGNEAQAALSFALDQLQVPPGQLPPPVEKLLPDRAGFTLALQRVPFGELWGVFIDFLTKGPSQEEPAAAIGGLRAVYPLMRNKSALALKGFAIEGPQAGVTADGEARIDPASPLLTSGDGAIVINNLDGMIATAKQMGAPPDFEKMVALVTAFGEPVEPKGSYRFLIAVTTDGKIMINDRSIDPLLQAFMR